MARSKYVRRAKGITAKQQKSLRSRGKSRRRPEPSKKKVVSNYSAAGTKARMLKEWTAKHEKAGNVKQAAALRQVSSGRKTEAQFAKESAARDRSQKSKAAAPAQLTGSTTQLSPETMKELGFTKSSGATMSASSPEMKAKTTLAKLKGMGADVMGGMSAALKGKPLTAAPKSELGGAGYYAAALGSMVPFGRISTAGKFTYVGTSSTSIKGSVFTMGVKSRSKIIKLATKLASTFKNPKVVLPLIGGAVISSIGGKAFGQYFIGKEENTQGVQMVVLKAYDQGIYENNWEAFNESMKQIDEVFQDDTTLGEIISWMPFGINVIAGVTKYWNRQKFGVVPVWKLMGANAQEAQTNEETTEDTYLREREQANAMYNESAEWNRQQNAIASEAERQANIAYHIANREADKKAAQETRDMWLAYKQKLARMEAEDRKAIAKFWIEYNKQKLKAAEDSRPSNLNFGLL